MSPPENKKCSPGKVFGIKAPSNPCTVDELCSGGIQSKKSKIIDSSAGIRTHTIRGKVFSCSMLYH
jgi:hypothetical protein